MMLIIYMTEHEYSVLVEIDPHAQRHFNGLFGALTHIYILQLNMIAVEVDSAASTQH